MNMKLIDTPRLLHAAMSRSDQLSAEMKRIGPDDLERAIGIQTAQQANVLTMKTSVQLHRHFERKLLNEIR